jgi:hypothetical protein
MDDARGSEPVPGRVTVVVDVANVMGSRPDGWWKDRAGAATKLLVAMPGLVGRSVAAPDGDKVVIERVVAVVEGAAKGVAAPDGVDLVRAPADGDGSIVSTAAELAVDGADVLVVTADRGLRARLAEDVLVAGPGWLNALLGR